MSYIFGQLVDFGFNDTKKYRMENVISLPTPTVSDDGYIVYNTVDELPYYWTGTGWFSL